MRGLYAIIDVASLAHLQLDVLPFAEAVLQAQPAALQLRDKRHNARATLALLQQLAPLCRRYGVPLFANDRADLAALAGCDGVHVGQDDLPPVHARAVANAFGRRALVGLSIHNLAQLEEAEDIPLDYLAFGPVFDTQSKARPDPTLGLDGLAALVAAASPRQLPWLAIGGITPENAAAVAEHNPCGAVIGALLPPDADADDWAAAVTAQARLLHRLLGGVDSGKCEGGATTGGEDGATTGGEDDGAADGEDGAT